MTPERLVMTEKVEGSGERCLYTIGKDNAAEVGKDIGIGHAARRSLNEQAAW